MARSVVGLVDGQTDFQRILALSPSLLIWPAHGAGWQGTSGGTLAASGQPLGLGVDLSQLQGKTLSEWLASAPELRSGGSVSTTGTPSPVATYNTSTGAGTANRVDGANSSGVAFSVTANVAYVIDIENTCGAGTLGVRQRNLVGMSLVPAGVLPGQRVSYIVVSSDTTIFVVGASDGQAPAFKLHSLKALPGNHLRAGTWASPSDAARGTFQNNAINFGGVDDYYSLLNAISITESMTVVRAFKRASAGINSEGIATPSGSQCHDGTWLGTDNITYCRMYDGGASVGSGSADTSTGSFVQTTRRTAANQNMRRNGTQIATGFANAPSGAFSTIGRRSTTYNSGEISFLAVFPSELTGANLALVEQIAASTNGSVLA